MKSNCDKTPKLKQHQNLKVKFRKLKDTNSDNTQFQNLNQSFDKNNLTFENR